MSDDVSHCNNGLIRRDEKKENISFILFIFPIIALMKAGAIYNLQSISPTFYVPLFHTKVLYAAFLYLNFRFAIFLV
jgi:hypothetical protein